MKLVVALHAKNVVNLLKKVLVVVAVKKLLIVHVAKRNKLKEKK